MNNQLNRRHLLLAGLAAPLAGALPSIATAAPVTSLPKAAKAQRIIVIGAGMAGLSAAHQLIQAGHEVLILEAQTRAGGRVLSVREPFADGLFGEAGAFWIPDDHWLTMHYVGMFDLPLVPLDARTTLKNYYIRGKRIRVGDGSVDWPVTLREDEFGLAPEKLIAKYISDALAAIGDPSAADWPQPHLKSYDDMTFLGLLEKAGASPGAIEIVRAGYLDLWGDGIHKASALGLLRDIKLNHLKICHKIAGGNDKLPHALAKRLGANIRYGTPVESISQTSEGVSVRVRGGVLHNADRLVCTIPFPVLRDIEIEPAFSAKKVHAIQTLPYTSVARVFLQTRERFWDAQGFSGYFATDLPVGLVGDCASYQPGTRGLLEAYVTGAAAREITAMAPADRVSYTLEQLEGPYPGVARQFEGGNAKCWDEDPWFRGDYAWFQSGQVLELYQDVVRAEQRIHFAGEHASPWPGWIQGAIHAGHRAAREIHDASV